MKEAIAATTKLPLQGRWIVVTRAREQAAGLVEKLRALGAEPLECPAISIALLEDFTELDTAISRLDTYDWVIFTSVNGVEVFASRMSDLGKDPANLCSRKLGAIGPATRTRLEELGCVISFMPDSYVAEAIVEQIGDLNGCRVLLPRADIARKALAEGLRGLGAEVDEVATYRTVQGDAAASLSEQLAQHLVDAITFTSASTVRYTIEGLEQSGLEESRAAELLNSTAVVCIGPITAATAEACGLNVTAVADTYTTDGLVEALVLLFASDKRSLDMFSARDAIDAQALSRRPRRLRQTSAMRHMVRETVLAAEDFIYPLFVTEGEGVVRPIASMPGQAQLSVDMLAPEIEEVVSLGIPAVLLFGIPSEKDAMGSGAWHPGGPVQRAIAAIKRQSPDTIVIADVCLCEYTDHGHCGVLSPSGDVLNDDTLELLARSAVSFAEAGADIVAPSAMMDGQVAALRRGLDAAGNGNVAILAYAAKYASGFYGPFREAAQSAPQFGDRRAYQMDPANAREALREVALDVEEGADMLMVKPAGPYLDIIRQVRDRYDLPLAAYQVSGEYAMLKAASANGWLDERRVVLESLTSIKRAGADVIISYYAKDAVRWIREGAPS